MKDQRKYITLISKDFDNSKENEEYEEDEENVVLESLFDDQSQKNPKDYQRGLWKFFGFIFIIS